MSPKTQIRLASMLSLGKPGEEFITLAYAGSEPQYPEKISNLRWSLLGGKWRVVDLVKLHKGNAQKAFSAFCSLLTLAAEKDSSELEKQLCSLFRHYPGATKEVIVDGRDFDTGVANLFALLASVYREKIAGYKQKFPIPRIVIKEKDGQFYHGYVYIPGEGSFKNLLWPEETPNFVKPFLEANKGLSFATT